MSDVTSFEVTGDWRHIVDDGMVDGDNLPDEVPLTGKVVFRPVYPTVATAGVPVTAYTLGAVTALIAGGVLTDLQGRPGVMLAGKVGEHTVRWSAETTLRFQEQKVDYPRVTFELTEDVRLTGIITQVGPSLSPIVVDPRIEALAASVESVNLAVVEAEGHASDAAEAVTLAGQEADRAIGLAGAQDEHIAGTLEDPTSATHAAFKAVGNATYETLAGAANKYLPTPADPLDGAFLAYDSATGTWKPHIGSSAAIVVSSNPDEPLADGQVHFLVEPEWSPLTLDLAWWFDATTIDAANGSPVTVWDERSGYARDVTHDVGTAPTYSASGLNGHPAVDFTGGALTSATFATPEAGPLTVFAVVQSRATNNQTITDSATNNANRKFAVGVTAGQWDATRGASVRGGTADTEPHLLTAVTYEGFFAIRVDGVELASRTDGGVSGDRFIPEVRVGARADGAGFLNGMVGEIFMVRGVLDPEQLDQAEQYLMAKWGI